MNKTEQYLSGVVRNLVITLAIFISISVSANGVADGSSPASGVLLVAQTESCTKKCAADKKSCKKKYTRTDINGVKFVTPEGIKLCGLAYRDCKSTCK